MNAAEKVIQMVRKINYKFDFPETAIFDQTGGSVTSYHGAMLRAADLDIKVTGVLFAHFEVNPQKLPE